MNLYESSNHSTFHEKNKSTGVNLYESSKPSVPLTIRGRFEDLHSKFIRIKYSSLSSYVNQVFEDLFAVKTSYSLLKFIVNYIIFVMFCVIIKKIKFESTHELVGGHRGQSRSKPRTRGSPRGPQWAPLGTRQLPQGLLGS